MEAMIKSIVWRLLLPPSFLCTISFSHAQNYPDKPIRIIIPFATGGFADIAGRTIAQAFTESLGVSVIPDNRAGAGGTIATEYARLSWAE